jgi:hypothetical protein
MKHVQFKSKNGEIINATLSDCGLICAENLNGRDCDNLEFESCDPDNYEENWYCKAHDCYLFAFSENQKGFTKWFIQAHLACQQAAQKVKG